MTGVLQFPTIYNSLGTVYTFRHITVSPSQKARPTFYLSRLGQLKVYVLCSILKDSSSSEWIGVD